MKKSENKILSNNELINIKGGVDHECICFSTPNCSPGTGIATWGGIESLPDCFEACNVSHALGLLYEGQCFAVR